MTAGELLSLVSERGCSIRMKFGANQRQAYGLAYTLLLGSHTQLSEGKARAEMTLEIGIPITANSLERAMYNIPTTMKLAQSLKKAAKTIVPTAQVWIEYGPGKERFEDGVQVDSIWLCVQGGKRFVLASFPYVGEP